MIKVKIYTLLLILISFSAFSQRVEKGKVITAPKIPQKNTPKKTEVKTNEFDFIFEDTPKLKFTNQFEGSNTNKTVSDNKTANYTEGIKIEPLRELNRVVHEDTSSIDEGDLFIVEIEEVGKFYGSDNMVTMASYYSIWDTKILNPYGIKPLDINEIVNMTLYNEKEGRKWHPMLDNFRLSSHFGLRRKKWHRGTDLALTTGEKIYSAFDGIVRISNTHSGYGRTVMVRHYNGLETLYAHLSSIAFETGTLVKAGDVIGLGGNTGRSSGPHLHFETRYEGHQFDSENIYDYTGNKVNIRGSEFQISSRLWDYLRGKNSRPSTPIKVISETENSDSGDEEIDDEFEEEVPEEVKQIVWRTVRPGDTLNKIAKDARITVPELARLNKRSIDRKLRVGEKLRIK